MTNYNTAACFVNTKRTSTFDPGPGRRFEIQSLDGLTWHPSRANSYEDALREAYNVHLLERAATPKLTPEQRREIMKKNLNL